MKQTAPFLLALSVSAAWAGCSRLPESPAGSLFVLTQVPAQGLEARAAYSLDPTSRYLPGSRVILAKGGARPDQVRVLSAGLFAAGAPAVSPDGRAVLFAAKRTPDSRWAIFEAGLASLTRKPRRLVETGLDCVDPAYLAGGRIVFTCGERGNAWQLYAATREGGSVERITFGPGSATHPSTLKDGRLMFSWQQDAASSGLYTLNPDGTWPEAFAGTHGPVKKLWRGRQTRDNGVVFLTQEGPGGKISLGRVEMRRPMVPPRRLEPGLSEVFSAEPLEDGRLILAGRGRTGSAAVFLWQESGALETVFSDPSFEVVEVVPVMASGPLKGRPSGVNPALKTGTLVCYDANRSDGRIGPRLGAAKAARVQVLTWQEGAQKLLGSSTVEEDGSFLIEVPSDRPIQVRTSDAKDSVVATSGWFWLRPGEVRSCGGCHEPHEAMARNRLIEAITHDPRRLETSP